MNRFSPRVLSDALDLYIRTYYSLLRSSGEVRVRAFEESHMYSDSSLHSGARDAKPDVAAFAYSAGRLPECMPQVKKVVMGQSHEQFEAAGLEVRTWEHVKTRGRRRALRFDGKHTLAAFITSVSDIDDLIPILCAYQIEWNKLHESLHHDARAPKRKTSAQIELTVEALSQRLGIPESDVTMLVQALGSQWQVGLMSIVADPYDCSVQLLSGSFSQYQRAAQRWWGDVEPEYLQENEPRRRPVYFVSSNTHTLVNLVGGYVHSHRDEIIDFARKQNPENLWPEFERALSENNEHELLNLTYYLLRTFLHEQKSERGSRIKNVQLYDAESGIRFVERPGQVDVGVQVIELAKLNPSRLDPRIRLAGLDALAKSNALIVNIDYPLGMAGYHLLSRLAQGVGDLLGLYVMGKAATLNGKVGDVMMSSAVYDEHSKNTYLYRNCFSAADVRPWIKQGTVLDGQKALTVRGAFLQNLEYMSGFYRDGYTVMEMEAGPYLSAVCELVNPQRHPNDEIVHLSTLTPFDLGILHYASDTPYSRRQSLLSKSLSYFGVESTYCCGIAILRRIFDNEIKRLA